MSRVFQSDINTNLHPSHFQFNDVPVLEDRTIQSVQEGKLIWSAENQKYSDIQMYNNDDNTTNYAGVVLAGIQEVSPFSKLFFSAENIKEIQKLLRYNVYKQSGDKHVISDQNETELVFIMRATYLSYAQIPYYKKDVTISIQNLNKITISKLIPDLMSNIEQYIGYRRDISQPYTLLDRGKNVSSTGTKSLRSVSDVLIGDDLFFSKN